MAEAPIERRGGLGKAFAEFTALPRLLKLQASDPGNMKAWVRELKEWGFNEDHLEKEDIPRKRVDLAWFIAQDAMRFCEWLQLIYDDGHLTPAGERVASLADEDEDEDGYPAGSPRRRRLTSPPSSPPLSRTEQSRLLTAVLAEQMQRHYVGVDGLELVPLLQDACAALAADGQPWSGSVGGLLLAEVDTVLHWGFADAERAREVARELPNVRHEIMERLTNADGGFGPVGGGWFGSAGGLPWPMMFSDAVAIWHYYNPEFAMNSRLSITELRVTAMAMVFAELFAENFWEFQVSVLAPAGHRS